MDNKKTYLLIGIGLIAAFILGSVTVSYVIDTKKQNKAASQVEKESSVSSTQESSRKKKMPDLTGEYDSDEGTDAKVKSVGDQKWRIDYQTGSESVYGLFTTEWKENAEGFKAKGTMYKEAQKYEFDFVVKVVSAINAEDSDAILVEFSNGNPNHKMTFKNKQARVLKLKNAESMVRSSSENSSAVAGRSNDGLGSSVALSEVTGDSSVSGNDVSNEPISSMYSSNDVLWARMIMTYVEQNINKIDNELVQTENGKERCYNSLKQIVEFRRGTHSWYRLEGNQKYLKENPEIYKEMTEAYKVNFRDENQGFGIGMPQAGGGVRFRDSETEVDLFHHGSVGSGQYVTSYSYDDINKFFKGYNGELVKVNATYN